MESKKVVQVNLLESQMWKTNSWLPRGKEVGWGINWEIGIDTYTHIHTASAAAAKSLVVSDSVRPQRRQPTRLPHPWDSPGKNTGVGYHFLLQWMKVKSESEVAQSCPTPSDPMDCSLPGSSINGIFQARVLEWGAIAFSHIHTTICEIDN